MPDELAELAAAANAMIGRLRYEEAARDQAEAARRDLVAAVSHDLRTPITSLRLLAEAVGDDIVDGEVRRGYLDRMRVHIDALSALIDDLFELSQARGRRHPLVARAGAARRPGRRDRGRHARAGRRQGRRGRDRGTRRSAAGAREPREAPAGPVQPDPERDPPHAGRRERRRARRAGRRPDRDRDRRHRRGDRARSARRTCSRRSTAAPTPPAPARGPGSGSRCHARSSRPTAGGSGSPTRRSARGCASACRWRQDHRRRSAQLHVDRAVSSTLTATGEPSPTTRSNRHPRSWLRLSASPTTSAPVRSSIASTSEATRPSSRSSSASTVTRSGRRRAISVEQILVVDLVPDDSK